MSCEYDYLRNKILRSNCETEKLEEIKDLIREDVKSKRRLENVNSVKDVILILEKRDLINVSEVSYLKNIARMLSINENEFVPTIVVASAYTTPIANNRLQQQVTLSVLNLEPTTYRQQIYSLVCEEIGIKWKNLARELKIKESLIDELEQKHSTIPDRVREILLYYENINIEGNWYGLLDALNKSRRKDLSNKVRNILSRHRAQ